MNKTPAKKLENAKRWRESHREAIRAKARRYYAKNRAAIREKQSAHWFRQKKARAENVSVAIIRARSAGYLDQYLAGLIPADGPRE